MLFTKISLLDENYEIQNDMYVGVKGDTISYIGKKKPEEDFGEEINGKNRLLMPGFYNAHAHSPMALMRGYGENLVLQDWLETKIFPFEDKLDSNAVYWGTMLCMAESIKYGIVSSSDMYYFIPDMVKAVYDSGMKANISRSIANPMGIPYDELPSIAEARESLKYHGYADGRVLIDTSLHAEYTNNIETATRLAEFTKEAGAIMHVHCSETKFEHDECIKRHGKTPAQFLNDCGLFDGPALAAHCVWCEPDDLEIFAEKGVSVATNPMSNLKLASGIANVPAMMSRKINVAVGTDSVASNNSLNFFEEMKAAAALAKVRVKDPTVVTPKEVLMMATLNGAKAQGRTDCGTLAAGKKADMIMLRTDVPNMHPVHNMVNNLVYAGDSGDIVMTIVDGKILYNNGEYTTIDIEKTIFEAETATEKILKML
ncbi:MAG: amidohydrolase [Eubacteriaceae bacterium]|nr:amidohydrolase [Eubacteriaceae bacterium]